MPKKSAGEKKRKRPTMESKSKGGKAHNAKGGSKIAGAGKTAKGRKNLIQSIERLRHAYECYWKEIPRVEKSRREGKEGRESHCKVIESPNSENRGIVKGKASYRVNIAIRLVLLAGSD